MRRILVSTKRVPRNRVLFSLMIAVTVVLAASSFSGSGQAGAYHVETTSWTTITSFTTTSSTIETGTEIQTITIIGVVVVAALATVAALSRFVRKPSLTLPTKPASQLPGGSDGRFFHEGYSEDTPSPEEAERYAAGFMFPKDESWYPPSLRPRSSPEESGWHLPGGRKILHAIDRPEGGAGGEGSEVSGWKGTPRGEGAGRAEEGGTSESSSRMGGSEGEGPASSEGGSEPVRPAWGGRDVVQRSGGSGSGGSDWRGTPRGGDGGGSVSQAGSEAAGSSNVSTIEPTKGTSDSVSATTPAGRGEEYTSQPPSSVRVPPPILVPPPAGGDLDARDMMQCKKCRKWISRHDMRPVPPEDPNVLERDRERYYGVPWAIKRIVSDAVKTLLNLPDLPEGICPNCGTRQNIPEYEYKPFEIRGRQGRDWASGGPPG